MSCFLSSPLFRFPKALPYIYPALSCSTSLAARRLPPMQDRGCSCVLVAVHRTLVGTLAVMDPIKPEARGVVAALYQMGIQCVMLTGDCWRTARAIAEQLGISTVVAEVLPAGKVAKIKVGRGLVC